MRTLRLRAHIKKMFVRFQLTNELCESEWLVACALRLAGKQSIACLWPYPKEDKWYSKWMAVLYTASNFVLHAYDSYEC